MSTLPDWNNEPEQWLLTQNIEAEKLLSNPLLQKDVWRTIEDLGLTINQHQKVLTITFEHIEQDWLTSSDDLIYLKQDLKRVEAELKIAKKLEMVRQQKGLISDQQNLKIRIQGLEENT